MKCGVDFPAFIQGIPSTDFFYFIYFIIININIHKMYLIYNYNLI